MTDFLSVSKLSRLKREAGNDSHSILDSFIIVMIARNLCLPRIAKKEPVGKQGRSNMDEGFRLRMLCNQPTNFVNSCCVVRFNQANNEAFNRARKGMGCIDCTARKQNKAIQKCFQMFIR